MLSRHHYKVHILYYGMINKYSDILKWGLSGRNSKDEFTNKNIDFPIALLSSTGDKNYALLRPASQSSTFGLYYASKAVDGNNIDDDSYAATSVENHPWWKVQLDTPIWVTSVEITNRQPFGMYQYSTCYSERICYWCTPFYAFLFDCMIGRLACVCYEMCPWYVG